MTAWHVAKASRYSSRYCTHLMPKPAAPEAAAAFHASLSAKIAADERSVNALSLATGVPEGSISHLLRHPSAVPSEDRLRTLASFFGDDADVIAARSGYANRRAAAPDPRI